MQHVRPPFDLRPVSSLDSFRRAVSQRHHHYPHILNARSRSYRLVLIIQVVMAVKLLYALERAQNIRLLFDLPAVSALDRLVGRCRNSFK